MPRLRYDQLKENFWWQNWCVVCVCVSVCLCILQDSYGILGGS